jgi:hypothetical protein
MSGSASQTFLMSSDGMTDLSVPPPLIAARISFVTIEWTSLALFDHPPTMKQHLRAGFRASMLHPPAHPVSFCGIHFSTAVNAGYIQGEREFANTHCSLRTLVRRSPLPPFGKSGTLKLRKIMDVGKDSGHKLTDLGHPVDSRIKIPSKISHV